MSKLPLNTADADRGADWAEIHARHWAHWMEAGRLWMSWWANALPALPWLPAGQLPPRAAPTDTVDAPAPNAAAPRVDAVGKAEEGKSRPMPRPRAGAARHH